MSPETAKSNNMEVQLSFDITKDAPVIRVDPAKIVNEFGCRPVLGHHIHVVKTSMKRNPAVSNNLVSVRTATVPEIEAFFKRVHQYSDEKAAAVAKSTQEQENAGGYLYAYDGHIRKFSALELIEENFFKPGFRFKGLLLRHLSRDEEIAYSLACNASNDAAIALTPVDNLLLCHEYDLVVNKGRNGNQKWISAVEVSKKMVSVQSSDATSEDAMKGIAETRRQYLSVSRRLPKQVMKYFQDLVSTDAKGLQGAFTIANLKAIKKTVPEEQILCLVKRMAKYYETCLPSPKPMHKNQVPTELVNIGRALGQVSRFMEMCEFESMPVELDKLVHSMTNTQVLDKELTENANKDILFPPLARLCEERVPGGTNRIALGESNILASQACTRDEPHVEGEIHIDTADAIHAEAEDGPEPDRSSLSQKQGSTNARNPLEVVVTLRILYKVEKKGMLACRRERRTTTRMELR